MRKVYSFPGITSGVVQVPVGKSHVCLNFAKGCQDRKKYRPALFTTEDATLQAIIENSTMFGSRIFLHKAYGEEEADVVLSADDFDAQSSSAEDKSYPEVTKWADAVRILKSIPGVEMSQLKTKESAKKVAASQGIVFPNYSFE